MAGLTKPTSSAGRLALAALLLALSVALQGCGKGGKQAAELGQQVGDRLDQQGQSSDAQCREKCQFDSLYGRWRSLSNGYMCWADSLQRAICQCTAATERPADCKPAPGGSSLAAVGGGGEGGGLPSLRRAGSRASGQVGLSAGGGGEEEAPPATAAAAVQLGAGAVSAAATTPRDTVNKFCDGAGLREMRGESAAQELEGGDAMADLESKIMGDIARELESNNVDKMAKEIFSFYVCVRWAPDSVFWKLAEQELPAQIANAVLTDSTDTKEDLTLQGIAEMYKNYQFVPLLCSQNVEVFREMDPTDRTYFRKFASNVNGLTDWLKSSADGVVAQELTKIDQTFCGDAPMNTCSRDSMLQRFKDFFHWGSTTKSMFAELKDRLVHFANGPSSPPEAKDAWAKDFAEWKKTFPFHSFIAKPDGFTAKVELSPRSNERFTVCFGKRVASELHRRPNGQHILTDQNNIGCHGWYTAKDAGDQMQRMVKLWRPPTCQLAEMTYVMKKEIMAKFQQMNERLFDSLPSIINDELEEEDNGDAPNWEDRLPASYAPKEVWDAARSRFLVDGMRVRFSGAQDWCLSFNQERNSCRNNCALKAGDLGTVHVGNQQLQVEWLGAHLCDFIRSPRKFPVGEDRMGDIQVMPDGWQVRRSVQSHVRDLVAGLSTITDRARLVFNAMFKPKQTNLADLMSGSVSKWAVCPIRDPVDLEDLDGWLGVEDAAFKDFQMEAYKKWTGFQAEIPGQKCVPSAQVLRDPKGFEKASTCEINELHADHVEKFTTTEGKPEQFTCPLRPPLPADEQLTVLAEKKHTCFLRMTGRQEQHYGWFYQGFFPARRQNDRKENPPRAEFELISLLKVPGGGIKSEVNFGRYCSLEELAANPRFCDLAVVGNMWDSVRDFAKSVAQSLVGLTTGGRADALAPLGLGASAVTSAIANFQAHFSKNFSDQVKDVAVVVGERTWDEIRGAGRLLRSTGQWVVANARPELPGTDRMLLNLDERLFGTSTSGELLHSMSFQRSIGSDGGTSNAKERFQRFVVSYPCPDFDPAYAFGLRRRWNRVVVRLVSEAYLQTSHKNPAILDKPFLSIAIRGEALRHVTTAERRPWYTVTASMAWRNDPSTEDALRKCEVRNGECFPARTCTRSRSWFPPFNVVCAPQDWWLTGNGWWPVRDDQLVNVVAPLVNNGNIDLAELFGIEMLLYCAPKKDFGPTGEPKLSSKQSLRDCLEKGVQTNALLRAREPWKLYFPDEVVVVAAFTPIERRHCRPRRGAAPDFPLVNETDAAVLCRGAEEDKELGAHLLNDQGLPHSAFAYSGGSYMGLHSGAGLPKGTLQEVVLRPEDLLEALQLMPGSNGR